MGELRWVLLVLGAVILLGVYAWGKGYFERFRPSWLKPRLRLKPRVEPSLGDAPTEPGTGSPTTSESAPETGQQNASTEPDRIVTVRFIPHDRKIGSDRVILALRSAGLRHGRYGIFHMLADESTEEPMFSVANLTEPGSFDLSNLSDSTIPGMSFFMVLPGKGDPVARFDRMVDTARALARDLDAELHDEKGSSWSFQRERYIREELIRYRHQSGNAVDYQ